MDKFKYLIIGGGVAGATAAETIRQNDQSGSIAVVNDEPYALYSRVMLSKPNFFLGQIPFDKVWLKGQEWYEKNDISFFGGKKAVDLDAANKVVTFSDQAKIGYQKLLLATGACARRWEVPGADKEGVFYLRTLEDGKAIMSAVKSAKRAVAIGGGFVSFEMADMLKLAELDVTVIIRESYFWEPVLDKISGDILERALMNAGVKIVKNAEFKEVLGDGRVRGILLKDGTEIPCDMIICGIGVTCPLNWLRAKGVNVNRGILTDEYLATNLPDVWAAGDVAEFKDVILDEVVQLGNWVNAREQGRIAGLNMLGRKEAFEFVSFYTTQGFGMSVAFVGDVRVSPDREVIERGKPETNSYARLIVLNKGSRKELEGATLINRTQELSSIAKLIEKNIDVSQKYKELADPNFDLKTLI